MTITKNIYQKTIVRLWMNPKFGQGTGPKKINTVVFNGASNVVQYGGLAIMSEQGQRECRELVAYYMANAKTIRAGLESIGLKCYGGFNAPYVWLKTPGGMTSWAFFDKLLTEAQVVCTPGAGFGKCGEGHVRISAFNSRENVETALARIAAALK